MWRLLGIQGLRLLGLLYGHRRGILGGGRVHILLGIWLLWGLHRLLRNAIGYGILLLDRRSHGLWLALAIDVVGKLREQREIGFLLLAHSEEAKKGEHNLSLIHI